MLKGKFIDHILYEKRYSKHTISAYQNDLDQFFSFCADRYGIKSERDIDHHVIRSWIIDLSEEGISARSVNRKLSTLKSYFRFLLKEGVLEANPMQKVIPPKSKKSLPVFIEEEKMEFLFEATDFSEGFAGVRDRLVLELLYATGMRLSELITLKEDSIDFANQSIRVLGKRNKERLVPVGPKLQSMIKDYLEAKHKLFNNKTVHLLVTDKGDPIYAKMVYRIVNNYLELVTTKTKKSPHVLRHTFATHMLNNGADLNAIKEILGHANLSATQVYTHNTIDKLKNIYKQAHPRA
jgi:integrase/recombinase XerC